MRDQRLAGGHSAAAFMNVTASETGRWATNGEYDHDTAVPTGLNGQLGPHPSSTRPVSSSGGGGRVPDRL